MTDISSGKAAPHLHYILDKPHIGGNSVKQLLISLALIFFLLPQALSAAAKQESTFNFTYLEAQRTRIVSKSGKEWRIWASYDEKNL